MEEESKIILYTTPDGKSRVSLMSRDGRVWLNQKQMAELFAVSKPNVSMLIAKILKEKELDDSVVKCYLTTAADGKKYKVIYYALEMILAVGFRVRGDRTHGGGIAREAENGSDAAVLAGNSGRHASVEPL